MKKICTKCKIEKLLIEFCKDKTHEDRLRSQCKNCESIKRVIYYQKNKTKIKIKSKTYYISHKNQVSKQNKIYRKLHKDEISKQRKEYRQINKQKLKEVAQVHYDKHKEKINTLKRQYYHKHKKESVEHEYLKNYNLTTQDVKKMHGRWQDGVQDRVQDRVQDEDNILRYCLRPKKRREILGSIGVYNNYDNFKKHSIKKTVRPIRLFFPLDNSSKT